MEVNWVCDNGYPNVKVNKMNNMIKDIKTKIYHDLAKNGLMVDKKKFDDIIDAGLFQDLGNRMGNKVANYSEIRVQLDDIFSENDYYLSLLEDFNGHVRSDTNINTKNDTAIWTCLVLVVIITLLCFLARKNA